MPAKSKRIAKKKKTVKKKAANKKAVKKAVRKRAVKKAKVIKKKKTAQKATARKKKKTAGKKIVGKKKKAGNKKAVRRVTTGGKKTTAARKETPAASSARFGKLSEEARNKARDEALRRLLVLRRADILKEAQAEIAKYIKGENRQLVETALDDGDWSVIDLSEDINLRKLGTHRQTLIKIDSALRKLDEGTYGLCEDCGDEIAPSRLNILPFAIYCRDCQESREELEAVEKEKPPSGR